MSTFDPFSETALADPFPQQAWFRAHDPVHWSDKLRAWVLFRHDDVTTALRDDARFSADRSRAKRGGGLGAAAAIRTVSSDPPACLPIRAMLLAALGPRVRAIGPFIDETVERLLDDVERAGPVVDLVETFAHPLPIAVIAELLDVPEADRLRFREQSRVIARGMDRFFGDDDVRRGLHEIGAYFFGLLQDRRDGGRDDLVTRLLVASHGDDRMSDVEVVAMCTALVFGGHETTVNLLASGALELLRRPDEMDRLRADPAALPVAIEELLRFETPPQLISRVAVVDVELRGRMIAAGDSVLLCLGAANRDPDVFAEPDRLDLRRHPNPHVGFGVGTHLCPGAALARLEARVAFSRLLARCPELRLADEPPVRRSTAVLRGLDRLWVRTC